MLRFALSAVALAAVLVTTHPSFADPLPAANSDHAQAQAAVATTEQPTPSANTRAPLSDAMAPVGFGWG
jgi:hypothetical protein